MVTKILTVEPEFDDSGYASFWVKVPKGYHPILTPCGGAAASYVGPSYNPPNAEVIIKIVKDV